MGWNYIRAWVLKVLNMHIWQHLIVIKLDITTSCSKNWLEVDWFHILLKELRIIHGTIRLCFIFNIVVFHFFDYWALCSIKYSCCVDGIRNITAALYSKAIFRMIYSLVMSRNTFTLLDVYWHWSEQRWWVASICQFLLKWILLLVFNFDLFACQFQIKLFVWLNQSWFCNFFSSFFTCSVVLQIHQIGV